MTQAPTESPRKQGVSEYPETLILLKRLRRFNASIRFLTSECFADRIEMHPEPDSTPAKNAGCSE